METPLILCDSNNRIISVTKPSLIILNRTARDVIGKKIEDIIDFEKSFNRDAVKRIIGKEKNGGVVVNIVPSLIYGKDYSVRGVIYNLSKLNEEPAIKSLFIDSGIGTWIWDIENKTIHLNDTALDILGLPKGKNCISYEDMLKLISREDVTEASNTLNSCISGSVPAYSAEYRIITQGGNTKWILARGRVVRRDSKGNANFFVGTYLDITELKSSETKLKSALKAKELLQQELHHRVKNNLQLIASMLNLHARRTKDAFVKKIIDDSRNRIHAMALIHEYFYKTISNGNVDITLFIKRLVRNLFETHMIDTQRISVEIKAKDIRLNSTQIIYCGLILNELISNSLEHAFPDGKKGKIAITLREKNREVFLNVNDNGKGFTYSTEKSKDNGGEASFGLILVKMFARQLGGELSIESKNGTDVTVLFKREE